MMDGKHHVEILKDLEGSPHDLVVIGALGLGRARDSVIARCASASPASATATSGSSSTFGSRRAGARHDPGRHRRKPAVVRALMTAVELARQFNKKVETIAVYDPYLHYSVFNGIVGVLTEQAAKVFRFEEQNQLHEEIIDTGLAQIYQSHLEVGEQMGKEAGFEVRRTLVDGKAFQKILDHARKTNPWLLVVGRIGVHSSRTRRGSGVTPRTCSVPRPATCSCPRASRCPGSTSGGGNRPMDARGRGAHEDVPEQVKGIARTGVLRLALEKGHSVVTSA